MCFSMRPGLIFVAALLIALVAMIPMRLVLDWVGLGRDSLSAREVRGSVWSGHLAEADFNGAALGDLSARLSPFQLALLRARVDVVRGEAGKGPFEGAFILSGGVRGVDGMTALVPIGNLSPLLPPVTVDTEDLNLRFAGNGCEMAEGRVHATLAGDIAGLDLKNGFRGSARCEGSRLLLPLVSSSGHERLTLRLAQDGAYEADLTIQTNDQATIERLISVGFAPDAGGYRLSVNGRP